MVAWVGAGAWGRMLMEKVCGRRAVLSSENMLEGGGVLRVCLLPIIKT